MANRNAVPSPVLSLPPLEYDVQYMNNLVRLVNYYIEQQDNPGQMRGSNIELADGRATPLVTMDTKASDTVLTIIFKTLPTSSAGLVSGQVWNDAGVLKIVT